MVPHLTILWIALVFMSLLLITIPFSGSFADERIEEILKEYKDMFRHFNIEVTGAFLTIVWISIAFMTGLYCMCYTMKLTMDIKYFFSLFAFL